MRISHTPEPEKLHRSTKFEFMIVIKISIVISDVIFGVHISEKKTVESTDDICWNRDSRFFL